MKDRDLFELLAMPHFEWPADEYPTIDAAKQFDPNDPLPLLKLLESSDLTVNARGLSVFEYLGRKGAVVLDQALRLNKHPWDRARNALMDGVICYSKSLNADQAVAVLQLIDDPFSLVREKVICFLAHADPTSLETAVNSLDESLQSEHRKGLDVLYAEHVDTQRLFDKAATKKDIWSAYAFASLERMARIGALTGAPEYSGNEYVPNGVIAHAKMHIAHRNRSRQ